MKKDNNSTSVCNSAAWRSSLSTTMNSSQPLRIQHSAFRVRDVLVFRFSFFLLAFLAPAQSTNDSSTTTDFPSFQVIVDENIFDPDRYGRTRSSLTTKVIACPDILAGRDHELSQGNVRLL